MKAKDILEADGKTHIINPHFASRAFERGFLAGSVEFS